MITLNLEAIFRKIKTIIVIAVLSAFAYTVYNKPTQTIQPAKSIPVTRTLQFTNDTAWGGRGW